MRLERFLASLRIVSRMPLWSSLRSQSESQLRHADDPVERGADLVAHAGQKLALGAVGDLGGLLFLAQSLGPFALGDIPCHPLDADDQPVLLGRDAHLRFAPENAAVLPDVLQFQRLGKPFAGKGSALDEILDDFIEVEDLFRGVGCQHLVKTNPVGILRGISVLGQAWTG